MTDPAPGQTALPMEHPAAEEPDEPGREAGQDGSRPRHHADAVWKSVPSVTGGFGCERATLYRELVRDDRGYRLDFGASERMLFGIAVDAAHEYLMRDRISNGPCDTSVIGLDLSDEGTGEAITEAHVRDLAGAAVQHAYEKARAKPLREPWDAAQWKALRSSLGLSVEKLLGLWPNRVREVRGERITDPEPDGTPPGPPIAWLDTPPGVFIEPQRRMMAPGVIGGRGVSGRPDYVWTRDGAIIAWIDVKAVLKAPTYPARWIAGDTVTYDHMCTVESGGVIPEWHGYLEYRRLAKPFWVLMRADVSPAAVGLAEAYYRRWQRALDAGDPDAVAFNPRACHDCDWRDRLTGPGGRTLHPGCPIGGFVSDMVEAEDENGPAEG